MYSKRFFTPDEWRKIFFIFLRHASLSDFSPHITKKAKKHINYKALIIGVLIKYVQKSLNFFAKIFGGFK